MQSRLRSHALNNLASGHISVEVLLKFVVYMNLWLYLSVPTNKLINRITMVACVVSKTDTTICHWMIMHKTPSLPSGNKSSYSSSSRTGFWFWKLILHKKDFCFTHKVVIKYGAFIMFSLFYHLFSLLWKHVYCTVYTEVLNMTNLTVKQVCNFDTEHSAQ